MGDVDETIYSYLHYYCTETKPIINYPVSILFFIILRFKMPLWHKDDKMNKINSFVLWIVFSKDISVICLDIIHLDPFQTSEHEMKIFLLRLWLGLHLSGSESLICYRKSFPEPLSRLAVRWKWELFGSSP